ncbi:glutamate 5-kinase [Paenibacillus baekrokdamisoli]|uniref:Glutamate 5-kinase n=1 Tax=Paenibacillus baekrokdamisoli TaxID=1712516 RepID=A0A3G9IL69_9BACL|nr:glutamate 5-kinase [Paenibacillus baekrokdamisoli]MBB3067141.1 glutamate 5-kinase [Paenibacillus baekrokdamisoli]BBH19667.1 glutamate 5-kinase [Paenibacillus baekrokdamisoli]
MTETIVVKIGSSSLTSDEGGINRERISFFSNELAALHEAGYQVILVTSGAVAAGFRRIGYAARPKLIHEKQAAAAVGQALLMQAYQEAFAAFGESGGIAAAQILLTRADFSNRKRIQNALMTVEELLHQRAVPIINENDTVATDELKFGDNDTLSALVANLVKAKRLIILTDMDGLYSEDPRNNPNAVRIERVDQISDEILSFAGGSGSSVGTGGMRSKIEAARISMRGGIPAFIGRVCEPGDMKLAVDGIGKGTYFDTSMHNLPMKKQWLGFHSFPQGRIVVDEGAQRALLDGGKSLLPVGIRSIEGDFHSGDVVEVINEQEQILGRGVVNYEAWQIQAVAGLSTEEVKRRMEVVRIEVIHRDEWVTLKS